MASKTPPSGEQWQSLSGLTRTDLLDPMRDGWAYVPPKVAPGTDEQGGSILLVGRPWEARGEPIQPTGGALNGFVRLASVADDVLPNEVLAFAQRWGTLSLCRNGFPGAGAHGCSDASPYAAAPAWWTQEPIAAWRRYSVEVTRLVEAFKRLSKDEPVSDDEWAAIRHARPGGLPPNGPMPGNPPHGEISDCVSFPYTVVTEQGRSPNIVDLQRTDVANALNVWKIYGGVKVASRWPPGQSAPRSHVAWDGLAGMLAVELMAAFRDASVFTCAGCGNSFTPEKGQRRPPARMRAWCPACGRLAQQREYQRGRYANPAVREQRRRRHQRSKGLA